MDEPTTAQIAEVEAHQRTVREHNRRMMDEAGVPTGGHSPRRGIVKATMHGLEYIETIEKRERAISRPRKGEEHYWIVTTVFDIEAARAGRYTSRHGFVIGPRGRVTEAY